MQNFAQRVGSHIRRAGHRRTAQAALLILCTGRGVAYDPVPDQRLPLPEQYDRRHWNYSAWSACTDGAALAREAVALIAVTCTFVYGWRWPIFRFSFFLGL